MRNATTKSIFVQKVAVLSATNINDDVAESFLSQTSVLAVKT